MEDEDDALDALRPSSPTRHNSTSTATSKLQLPPTTDPPGPHNPPKPLVWLIFGATGHMGRSIAKAALQHNDKICAVGRTFENSIASMQQPMQSPSPGPIGTESTYLGLLCDVRVRSTVEAAIARTIEHFGHIDIIANCSGYGVLGSCEDQDEYEIRDQFETNFMGTLNIIQLSLPHFRQRQAGRYLIFSSISGALGVPGLGPYCSTKYAVEGLIESMLYEVDDYNIKATLVELGYASRDDVHDMPGLANGTATTTHLPIFGHFKVKPPSAPYNSKDSPAAHARRVLQWIGNNQPTSAVRSAELVWQLGHCRFPPLRLLLGTYAVESIRERLRGIIEEIEDWKHLNFPAAQGEREDGADAGDMDGDGDGDDDHDGDAELEHDEKHRVGSDDMEEEGKD